MHDFLITVFAALAVYTVLRCLLSANYALKRRYMRSIMKDLTGEPNGTKSR